MINNIKEQYITFLKHSLVKNDDRSSGTRYLFDDVIKLKVKENVDKTWLPTFQGTEAGFRVAKYDENYFSYWNGWIFVDIDHTDDESETMIHMLHEKLSAYTFYKGSQLSTSGHGIHIFFYVPSIFNLAEEYYADAVMCYNLVFSFINKKYFDEHNFQHSQLFKMSKYEWLVNENFDAAETAMKFDCIRDIDDYWSKVTKMFPESIPGLEIIARKEVSNFYHIEPIDEAYGGKQSKSEFVYEIINDDFKYANSEDKKFHLSHSGRYALYCTLMAIYDGDKVRVKNALRYIMKFQKGKHTYNQYVNEHDGTKDKDFKVSQYILDWLKVNFGFRFVQKEKINEINLTDNDWIGKHEDELLSYLKPGINMLIAGTGTGKTEIWKQLNDEVCGDMLALNELPILVVEPYNSIIDSKYNKGEVHKVTKNTKFPKEWTGNAMYVTNYNHVISGINEGEFRRFKYIVIDESHLLTKEKFRCDVLLRFIDAVKLAAKESIVVLQTGTPMDEEMLFDNINKIKVNKQQKKHIEYCYRTTNNISKFDIVHISKMVRDFVSEGRKVYIYWNDISLTKCNKFKELNSDLKIAVYHKKNKNNDTDEMDADMLQINEGHVLGDKFDIIISSVYFGVGNDLNDEGKTACIIIGNNAWQEDIQVIGRWRKSNDIKVVSVFNNDKCMNYSKDGYDDLLRYKIKNLRYNFNDKTNRNKSITINHKAFMIEREEWIPTIAMMSICELFNSVIDYKNIKLREYGIDVDDKFEELDADLDRIDEIKEYNRKIKSIRDIVKRDFIDSLINNGRKVVKYSNDSRVEGWEKAVVSLYDNCKEIFDKLIVNRYLTKVYHMDSIKLFVRIIKNVNKGQIDAAEIHAFRYFREMMKGKNVDMIWKDTIKYSELYGVAAYVMFMHYKNKVDKDYAIKADYFYDFYKNCLNFNGFDEEMIGYLNEHWKETTATDEFFDIKDKIDPSKTYNMIERSILYNKTSEKRKMEVILAKLNNKHLNAGRNSKKVVIDGVEYENVKECAKALGVSEIAVYKRLERKKS